MLSLPEEELKTFVEVDDYILGAWKLESRFKRGRFIRQKCYIEENEITEEEYKKGKEKGNNVYIRDNKYYSLNVTVAGLPKKLGKYVNFENFKIGFSILASDPDIDHKLTYKHVDGGVMLVDTDFTIK